MISRWNKGVSNLTVVCLPLFLLTFIHTKVISILKDNIVYKYKWREKLWYLFTKAARTEVGEISQSQSSWRDVQKSNIYV